ncbi:MAG: hypothetical protein GWN88_04475, partial [Nitrospinaceae bacterium]|nr:hypothetical protein [Nitrospinaceae bacterium]
LEELEASGNGITGTGLQALCRSPNLRHLKKLDLRRNRFTLEDQIFLSDSPKFQKLESLRF